MMSSKVNVTTEKSERPGLPDCPAPALKPANDPECHFPSSAIRKEVAIIEGQLLRGEVPEEYEVSAQTTVKCLSIELRKLENPSISQLNAELKGSLTEDQSFDIIPRSEYTERPVSLDSRWMAPCPSASFEYAALFGGERLSQCDEIIALRQGRDIVAVASIAPYGEDGKGDPTGEPTIVGMFTDPAFRKQGCGTLVLTAALLRLHGRGFMNVVTEATSDGGFKAAQRVLKQSNVENCSFRVRDKRMTRAI